MIVCTLSYTEEAMEAERRIRRGDRQLWCPTCRLWRWQEECDHTDRLTERAFRAMVRAVQREYPVRKVRR